MDGPGRRRPKGDENYWFLGRRSRIDRSGIELLNRPRPTQGCRANRRGIIYIKTLKAKLNPICHLLALLGAHHILHVGRIMVNKQLTCYLPAFAYANAPRQKKTSRNACHMFRK